MRMIHSVVIREKPPSKRPRKQSRGRERKGVDGCMEVDGRIGERRGNIYIKKHINMGRLYNYYQ